jgi:ATP-dependent Clp protease ATP-binding subunit ClpA
MGKIETLLELTTMVEYSTYQNSDEDDDYEARDFEAEERAKGPALEVYGTDITLLARLGKLEECFGRDKELLELMEILVRRQKNNPVLVGDAGVGKTAIVELFANRIVNNLVPFILEGRSIVSIDLARIVAGSRYRGEFELRFQRVLDEILNQPNIIMFIDEIHNLGGTGSAEGSLDAANILKPILSRSGFQCIGATTTKEYQKIEKDPALNRRFQPIKVKEPTIDDTVDILYGLRPALESFHNVEILPGALRLSAELAARYIQDRFLPDKAIDLVDRAAAKEVIRLTNVTEGSVISAVVNAGLNNLGRLRMEAFRRGDIPVEFIFQEIENAYRNFLLRWIEVPSEVPEVQSLESKAVLSPIGQKLFDDMRISVLRRVDQLLFASANRRTIIRTVLKIDEISQEKNTAIMEAMVMRMNLTNPASSTSVEYSQLSDDMRIGAMVPLSLHRISLFLFICWSEIRTLVKLRDDLPPIYFDKLVRRADDHDFCVHLDSIRDDLIYDPCCLTRESDFWPGDIERYQKSFELLSELEEMRIEIFKEFLKEMRPLLRKGMIQSLKYTSEIPMNESEMSLVYTLMGYFSTESGRQFLYNLEDPELIRKARKIGDFSGLKKRITQREIRELLADMTGIPMQSISNGESQKLINLEATLHKRVIGQEEAISAIAKAIRRSRLGIQNPNRPIASFLFCGPTGVGKTEVCKALAISMFTSEDDMIRFDMSEFMEKFALSRLIGSPPGYIGYDEGGQLTDAVRRKPYSVVLFDEVEKAHPDILNILLQILEDGRLTDSQKRLIPFENTIIIMTSNAAAEEIQQIIKNNRDSSEENFEDDESLKDKNSEEDGSVYHDEYSGAIKFLQSPITENFLADIRGQLQIEFEKSFRNLKEYELLEKDLQRLSKNPQKDTVKKDQTLKDLKSAVLDRLSNMFLPEFLNRLDDIIVFQPLTPEELRKICDIMIQGVADRVKPKQIILKVEDKVKAKLTREGYNPIFGARPLRRLVTKYIEDLISDNILQDPITTKKYRVLRITVNDKNDVIWESDPKEKAN